MIQIIRSNAEHADFLLLVKSLNAELLDIDGEDQQFYAPLNKIDAIKHTVIAYENGNPVACGAMKQYLPGIMEIKRMYTSPSVRGRRIAEDVLKELEIWARELSVARCVLETGKRQPAAISLYTRAGYKRIDNYGPYKDDENSVCFEKELE